MAKTKSTGGTKLGRDSQPKYLGVKLFDGQKARTGEVLVRQRGTEIFPGQNVKLGADNTLYAAREGIVRFQKKRTKRFDDSQRISKIVFIEDKTKHPTSSRQ